MWVCPLLWLLPVTRDRGQVLGLEHGLDLVDLALEIALRARCLVGERLLLRSVRLPGRKQVLLANSPRLERGGPLGLDFDLHLAARGACAHYEGIN